MESKRKKPNFMFGVAELMQLGDKATDLGEQDAAVLAPYGVNQQFLDLISDKTNQLKDFSTDEELEGKAMILNEIKIKMAEAAKISIRTMMIKVKQVFKNDSGNLIRFGTKGMNAMKDLELIKCGFRVVRMSNIFLPDLAVKGVTQAMIDALETDIKNYDKSYDDQQDAKLLRNSITYERLLLANELYALITELFDYGKDYWSSRNAARYKDYLIYNTTSGKKQEAEIKDPVK